MTKTTIPQQAFPTSVSGRQRLVSNATHPVTRLHRLLLLSVPLILAGCDQAEVDSAKPESPAEDIGLTTSVLPLETRQAAATVAPRDFTYSVRTVSIPLDKNGIPIPVSVIEGAIQTAVAIWTSVAQVSFKEVTWDPSKPATLNFAFLHHYSTPAVDNPDCNVGGSWDGTTVAFYTHRSCGTTDPANPNYYSKPFGGNGIMYTAIHEAGHALELPERVNRRISCNANYSGPPLARCHYMAGDGQAYWNWRMGLFKPVADDFSRPADYNVLKDIRLSSMDDDASGNAEYNPPSYIGYWGRPYDQEDGQPSYPSQYDINQVQARYGAPTDALPILPMKLCNNWDTPPKDFHCNSSGYMTTDMSAVNDRVRMFQAPSDLRELMGLAWRANSSANSRTLFTRYYNSSLHTYFVAKQGTNVGTGWVAESYLGYWENSRVNAAMKIGTISRLRATIPIYQYATANKSLVFQAKEYIDPAPAGYTRTLLGHIVPWDEITERAVVFAADKTSGNLRRFDSSWATFTGTAKSLSGSSVSSLWAVDNAGLIKQLVSGSWVARPKPANKLAIDIAATDGNKAFVLTADNMIYQWTGSAWTAMQGLATRIDVGPGGNSTTGGIWVVNAQGLVYELVRGSGWISRPGIVGQDIAVGPNGLVYATSTDNKIYKWAGSWQQVAGSGTKIDVDPFGHVWVIDTAGQVLELSAGGLWLPRTGVTARDIAAVSL